MDTLRRRPELLSLLTDRADLVLLCGESETKLSQDDRELLATLATGVPALQAVVTTSGGDAAGPVRVVANIPYSITTPIIERLLEHKERLSGIALLVQKEAEPCELSTKVSLRPRDGFHGLW